MQTLAGSPRCEDQPYGKQVPFSCTTSHRLNISHKTSHSKYELYNIIDISMKISTLVIESNEVPITHQTAFPNMFSTLTSFLYPAMYQARISNVRTLGEKTSHIKLIFLKYIVDFCLIILGEKYAAYFT